MAYIESDYEIEARGTGYVPPPCAMNVDNEDQETGEEHEVNFVSFSPNSNDARLDLLNLY